MNITDRLQCDGFQLKKCDLWVGVYWRRSAKRGGSWLEVWICFLPCLPLYVRWRTDAKSPPVPKDQGAKR
ncbi:MAG TPA: hypothetical protein VMW52_01735 [Phycisphaerae bacterium]|nr:hypothetical protein [Phycisphaerae bacterium]